MSVPLLQAERLTKSFQSGASSLTILDEVTFGVDGGESLALVGESGAGKSTLLYLLGGLDQPTSGEVLFDSQPLSGRSEEELAAYRNRQIGFVWQTYHLLPEFTALENAAMPLLIAGEPSEDAYLKAGLWLERVGLAERAQHRSGELSGGEQQRVTIARALAASPKILLADEPTGNLDSATADAVIDLLLSLPKKWRLGLVVATHNRDFASRCDRTLRVAAGKVSTVSVEMK